MIDQSSMGNDGRDGSPQRKRKVSGETASVNFTKVPNSNAGTQTDPAKRGRQNVPNNGWGTLFKNKETFVEMHIC